MRGTLSAVVACVLMLTAAYTEQLMAAPVVEDELAVDGCLFKLKDPYKGRVSTDTQSSLHSASYIANVNGDARYPFETWILFTCRNSATARTYVESASIKPAGNGWALDTTMEDPNFPNPNTALCVAWQGLGGRWNHAGPNGRRRR
jgi:hypothetical protein